MRTLALLAVVVVALLAGAAHAGTEAAAVQRSIVVTGSGSVSTVPDRAQVSFGVSSTAKTASGALRANSAEMAKVIAAVKAQGVAAADIRTEAVSLSPRTSSTGEEIIGYTAFDSVGVTLRALDKVGGVIDAAVDAGANQVSGPSLARSDANALYRAGSTRGDLQRPSESADDRSSIRAHPSAGHRRHRGQLGPTGARNGED